MGSKAEVGGAGPQMHRMRGLGSGPCQGGPSRTLSGVVWERSNVVHVVGVPPPDLTAMGGVCAFLQEWPDVSMVFVHLLPTLNTQHLILTLKMSGTVVHQ